MNIIIVSLGQNTYAKCHFPKPRYRNAPPAFKTVTQNIKVNCHFAGGIQIWRHTYIDVPNKLWYLSMGQNVGLF